MRNCLSCFKTRCTGCDVSQNNRVVTSPQPLTPSDTKPPPLTSKDVVDQFKAVKDLCDVDNLISDINQLWERKTTQKSAPKKPEKEGTSSDATSDKSMWASFINSGATFLKFVDSHTEKIEGEHFFHSGETTKVLAGVLQQVDHIHWIFGGLSIIGYLLEKVGEVSANRSECLELLKYMVDLATHIRNLKHEIPDDQEKLRDAMLIIVEGSIICAVQLHSGTFFRYWKSSVDSDTLSRIRMRINQIYPDLTLTVLTAVTHQLPVLLPLCQPDYPDDAVGIKEPVEMVIRLLNLTPTDESSRAVVIYGVGGIGKTTLATAVQAKLNLKDYEYARIEIDVDPAKNDFKSRQQQILKDGFPKFEGGKPIMLRDCQEGRDRLMKAFKSEGNKPLFLFIDNALRADDLEELLPSDLRGLPKGSRIMVTTRNLGVTDVFVGSRGLPRFEYDVPTLPDNDARTILFADPANVHNIGKEDVERILQICGGIPLVLELVGARLRKPGYRLENCSLFDNLVEGNKIKDKNLSERLVDFVFRELEVSTQEAFLDICSYFNGWSRGYAEIIFGDDFTLLKEAALVKTSRKKLFVHDVIRANGRNLCKSTRITDMQSFHAAVQAQTGLNQIKGVLIGDAYGDDYGDYECEIEETQLSSMCNSLRIIGLGNIIKVRGQSPMAFKELRYLIVGGGFPCFPMRFETLEKLAMYKGPIFLEGVSILCKLPKKLKVVIAVHQSNWNGCKVSQESKSIQASQYSCLQMLSLSGMAGMHLETIPEGLDQLISLEILDWNGWDRIEEFPENVCGLSSLNSLSIENWSSLKRLPESFGQLRALNILHMYSCQSLTELPSCFGQLTALEHLNLSECSELKKLPSTFVQLKALKRLYLYNCKKLKEIMPSGFEELTALKCLDLRKCTELRVDLSQMREGVQIIQGN